MWKKSVSLALQPWRMIASRSTSNVSNLSYASNLNYAVNSSKVSSAVNSILLRSLEEHYQDVSEMSPPPKVAPPSPFTVVQDALENDGPILKQTFNEEDIGISAMRMAAVNSDEDDGSINELILYVHITKPSQPLSLQFLCGLYPDAVGIHSVSLLPNTEAANLHINPTSYPGPTLQKVDPEMRNAFHAFIAERGINASLFPYLQSFVFLKDYKKLLHWFKSVSMMIPDPNLDA